MVDSLKKVILMREIFQDMAEAILLGTGTSAGECADVANRFATRPANIAALQRIGQLALMARRKNSDEECARFFLEAIEADQALKHFLQCAPKKLGYPVFNATNPAELSEVLGRLQILR